MREMHDCIMSLDCLHPVCFQCSEDIEITVMAECSICAEVNLPEFGSAASPAYSSTTEDNVGLSYRPSSKVTALLGNLTEDRRESANAPYKRYRCVPNLLYRLLTSLKCHFLILDQDARPHRSCSDS